MKHLFILSSFLISSFVFSQCPLGNVEFNSQSDIDDFLSEYPSCTEIQGDLIINSTIEQDPITSLLGLNSLESIEGGLFIYKLFSEDEDTGEIISGSLEGLEGLESVHSVFIGEVGLFSQYYIETLEPLTNLSGAIESLHIHNTSFSAEHPDFDSLTNIDSFEYLDCKGSSITPTFSNLISINRFQVVNATLMDDDLTTIVIPDVNTIGSTEDEDVFQGILIEECASLEQIIGGEGLEFVANLVLTNHSVETSFPAFDEIVELRSVLIRSCDASYFDLLPSLSLAGEIELFLNTSLSGCANFIPEVIVSIGENAEFLRAMDGGLKIQGNDIGELTFTAEIDKLNNLQIQTYDVLQIDGFQSLDSIVTGDALTGVLNVYTPGIIEFPDFGQLKSIDRNALMYIPSSAVNTNDLGTFSSLEEVIGSFDIYVLEGNTSLVSLNGLQNLKRLEDFELYGAAAISDITAITGIEEAQKIVLGGLPELDASPSFENLDSLVLRYYGCDFTELPLFPNATSVSLEINDCNNLQSLSGLSNVSNLWRLVVNECDGLQSLSGLSNLNTLSNFEADGNTQLTQLGLPTDLTYLSNGILFTWNVNFDYCGNDPSFCNILSQTTGPGWNTIFLNGEECGLGDDIIGQCLLSQSERSPIELKVWIDQSNQLAIESSLTGNVQLAIRDVSGRIVYQLNRNNFSSFERIDLPEFGAGLYLVEISSNRESAVQKIVIQ